MSNLLVKKQLCLHKQRMKEKESKKLELKSVSLIIAAQIRSNDRAIVVTISSALPCIGEERTSNT